MLFARMIRKNAVSSDAEKLEGKRGDAVSGECFRPTLRL